MTETTAPVTVHQAWAAVMADVRALGKDQTNTHQRFNFRGVDDVMNAVGPALRAHGVSVVPTDVDLRTRDAQTSNGKPAHETMVVVRYTIYGPAGDSMPGAAAGESLDSGDKATPKAMSVAYRTFLLQALCLPTHDTDPDAQTYERAAELTPAELAQQVADTIAQPDITEAQVRDWGNKAHGKGLLDTHVRLANSELLPLSEFVQRRLGEVAA